MASSPRASPELVRARGLPILPLLLRQELGGLAMTAEIDPMRDLAIFDPIGFTHLRSELCDDTDDAVDVPLCFVGECRRSGATAAELNLTFDQALDIEDFPRTDDRDAVSCPDCREWIRG